MMPSRSGVGTLDPCAMLTVPNPTPPLSLRPPKVKRDGLNGASIENAKFEGQNLYRMRRSSQHSANLKVTKVTGNDFISVTFVTLSGDFYPTEFTKINIFKERT